MQLQTRILRPNSERGGWGRAGGCALRPIESNKALKEKKHDCETRIGKPRNGPKEKRGIGGGGGGRPWPLTSQPTKQPTTNTYPPTHQPCMGLDLGQGKALQN